MNIVIVGKPNVGKSSLFNRLCGKTVSITNDAPDTTVDYIGCTFENGIIYDTFGHGSYSKRSRNFKIFT